MKHFNTFGIILAYILISSCGSTSKKVTITTPYDDAQICCELLNNCSSLNEIQEAKLKPGEEEK